MTEDQQTLEKENRQRIKAVEKLFGPSAKPLYRPGRVLMAEGRLRKQSRRKAETKAFFLFSDVLVYGSVVVSGCWLKKQKIISLEDVQLEDTEDGTLQNQWLIRTPRKSFFVSAPSSQEKRAWIHQIQECRSNLGSSRQPGSNFAVSWIPDRTSYKCMRCLKNFGPAWRRHHCRKCGFLVCDSCSKQRQVIDHIHPTKRLRVCRRCHESMEEERSRGTEDVAGGNDCAASRGEGEDEEEEEEEEEERSQSEVSSYWLDTRRGTWGQMNRPMTSERGGSRPRTAAM